MWRSNRSRIAVHATAVGSPVRPPGGCATVSTGHALRSGRVRSMLRRWVWWRTPRFKGGPRRIVGPSLASGPHGDSLDPEEQKMRPDGADNRGATIRRTRRPQGARRTLHPEWSALSTWSPTDRSSWLRYPAAESCKAGPGRIAHRRVERGLWRVPESVRCDLLCRTMGTTRIDVACPPPRWPMLRGGLCAKARARAIPWLTGTSTGQPGRVPTRPCPDRVRGTCGRLPPTSRTGPWIDGGLGPPRGRSIGGAPAVLAFVRETVWVPRPDHGLRAPS